MTPEELKQKMKKLVHGSEDYGAIIEHHEEADNLMVATLRELGYGEAMDIYEEQTRWYA